MIRLVSPGQDNRVFHPLPLFCSLSLRWSRCLHALSLITSGQKNPSLNWNACFVSLFSPRSFDRTLSCKRGLRLELVGAWQKSGRNEDAFVRIKSGSLIHPSPSFFCSIWIGKNSLTQFRRGTSLTARAPFQLLVQGLSAKSGGSVETIKARDEALIPTVIQDIERKGEFQSYQIFN